MDRSRRSTFKRHQSKRFSLTTSWWAGKSQSEAVDEEKDAQAKTQTKNPVAPQHSLAGAGRSISRRVTKLKSKFGAIVEGEEVSATFDEPWSLDIVVYPDPTTALPSFVYILPTENFKEAKAKLLKRVKRLKNAIRLADVETYPFDETSSGAFEVRFRGTVHERDLVPGVLLVLLAAMRYVPHTDFKDAYDSARLAEAVDLMICAGAKSIIIDKDEYASLKFTHKASGTLEVPVSAPGIQEGGSAEAEVSGASTRTNSRLVKHVRQEVTFFPYKPGHAYFYDAGKQDETITAVVTNVESETPNVDEITVWFDTKTTQDKALKAAVDAATVVGFAVDRSAESKHDWSKKITIEFFDKETLKQARKYICGPDSTRVSRPRFAVARLATARAEFAEYGHQVREDIIVHLPHGADVRLKDLTKEKVLAGTVGCDIVDALLEVNGGDDEITVANTALATFGLLQSTGPTGPSKTMVLPFVVYGPEQGGRTSLVCTFKESVSSQPEDYVKKGWGRFDSLHGLGGSVEFLKDIKFDPNPNPNMERFSESLGEMTDEVYTTLPTKAVANCVFKDTQCAAESAFEDMEGRQFPFGTLILALDYGEALAAFEDASKHMAADRSFACQWDHAPTAKSFRDKVTPLLGAKVVTDRKQRRGKLARYPPMATVLTKCTAKQVRDQVMVDKVVAWCKEVFEVVHVFAMETFVAPQGDEITVLTSSMSKMAAYKKLWMEKAEKALVVLAKIIDATAVHEELAVWRLRKKYKEAALAQSRAAQQST